MARKGWSALSPNYRKRLEKSGITEAAYERGESIKKARGHENTPERPSQAKKGTQYANERAKLVRDIATKKQKFFGTSPKWNLHQSTAVFRMKPPPMAKLRQWVKLTLEKWLDALREDANVVAYLGYH